MHGSDGARARVQSRFLESTSTYGKPDEEIRLGSVIKKRRKKMRKHKYKKLRSRMRHKRKRGK